ncbi:MAG: hypothetical protein HWE21_07140 [Cytophagia bacterium]|nr:hypothetical protein [Cytophagia bacterium]
MKKLVIIILLLGSAHVALGQTLIGKSYDNFNRKEVTFQVVPTVVDFDGVKFGFGIGLNIRQVISLNYFHARDYGVNTERPYLDNRFSGFHLSIAQPIFKRVELAAGVRKGILNNEPQKTIISGELRYKFNKSWRMAFEYGGNGNKDMTGMKLIYNLY